MKPFTFFCFFCMAVSALAQSAVVQPLTEAEAEHSKQLYAARDAADKAVDAWNEQLEKKYLRSYTADADHNLMHGGCINIGCESIKSYWIKTGWGNGFQYDKTFHFIVPAEAKPALNSTPNWNCGGATLLTPNWGCGTPIAW